MNIPEQGEIWLIYNDAPSFHLTVTEKGPQTPAVILDKNGEECAIVAPKKHRIGFDLGMN